MNYQIAFAIALVVIVFLVALLFGAALKQREMQGDHEAALSDLRERLTVLHSDRRDLWAMHARSEKKYGELLEFLYEEGIEVRPYKAPEIPKYELRIGNRPERG